LRAAQIEFWTSLLRGEVREPVPPVTVDLGCGLGRFSGLLRDLFGGSVIGLDRSARMLEAARTDPTLTGARWLQASAEAVPLASGSTGLVFSYLVLHHLRDRPTALRECARILAPAAILFILNSTVESLDSYVWVPFFPFARAIDLARLPTRVGVLTMGAAAGLSVERHRTVRNPVSPGLRAYAARIASRTLSTLQLVPDDEFARGSAEFTRYCEREDRGQPVESEIDLFVFRRPTT
jgi:SAM-dependent methyltransferase